MIITPGVRKRRRNRSFEASGSVMAISTVEWESELTKEAGFLAVGRALLRLGVVNL